MKIAYLAFSETFGAPDAGFVHTYNIVKNLAKLVTVRLFIKNGKSENEDFETIDVILPSTQNLAHISPLEYAASYSKIKKKIEDVDIIHERFHVNPIDLAFVGRRKYVLEVNDPGIETWTGWRKLLYSPLVKLKFKKSDAIITQTETLKRMIKRHTDKPIYVVPNGVDADKFKPSITSDVRAKHGINDDEILVTYVGSFREWHGTQNIPEISAKLGRNKVKFLLVGSGTFFDELKMKSDPNIILAGPQKHEDIPKFLAVSDILIAPFDLSRFKQMKKYGFWWSPVKLYEYMASGKPIVAYNHPEVASIVKEAALLAEPGSLGDFVEKIIKLIDNADIRIEMGRVARKIAVEEYDWRDRAKKILKIYEELLVRP